MLPMALRSASNRDKVARHRAGLRAAALKPLQIWIPVVAAAEAERQARMVNASAEFDDVMRWIEATGEFDAEHDATG